MKLGEFIAYRVLARSMLASLPLILFYSLLFGIFKLLDLFISDMPLGEWTYFRIEAWVVIAILALVYPLNQAALHMLFKPIDSLIDRKTRKVSRSVRSNPFLRGNFAPLLKEYSYELKELVEGEVPADLEGCFLKIGPNPKFVNEN
mmetsp:Transcript_19442/g.33074  ORF Transcript_19442/g.33074 Transcript_19442/m.33074 type:complete len:146 (-) Transcript_19442:1457-1894(-)